MYADSSVGVVVPAYNEEDHVADVLSTMPSFVDRVYVIDDCSTDNTWTVIQRTVEELGNGSTQKNNLSSDSVVVPIRHRENRGVGGAIKTGYLRALEEGIDVVAVMGGDDQMDPSYLDAIVEPIAEGRADYAKGNRLLLSETRRTVPGFRTFGNVLLSSLTKIASGYWDIGDSQNGYAAISREALETIDIEELYEFYGYCNDLLVRLNVAEMVVVDVPVPIRYEDETSTIEYRTYVPRVSSMLFRNFLWRLKQRYVVRDFNPVVLQYALGIGGSLLTLVRSVAHRRSSDSDKSQKTILTEFLICVLALIQGMMNDKMANEHLARRERRPKETVRSDPDSTDVDPEKRSDQRLSKNDQH